MDKFLIPQGLKKGDSIGVISPSDLIESDYLDKSIEIVRSWGLKVVLGEHVYDQEEGFAAGTAEDRYSDLKKMVLDKEIKMIWCSSGGFAATQLWPLIEDDLIVCLKKSPKTIMGYSDICILTHLWFRNRVGSIHGPNFSGFSDLDNESQEWTRKMLFDEIENNKQLIENGSVLNEGISRGRLLCSNLDSLVACFGTKYDPFDSGEEDLILGIEEYEQYKSDIQRQIDMIMNHKRSFRIKGFVLGKFRNLKFDAEYSSWYLKNEISEIITKRIKAVEKTIPIISWSNFGHIGDRFLSLKNGLEVELRAKGDQSGLIEI